MKGVKDTSGKRSQAKGRAGELELCRLLQDYGYPVQHEWIQQAQRDSEKFKDGLPAVFWRKNRAKWLVCMTLADWMSLYQQFHCKSS